MEVSLLNFIELYSYFSIFTLVFLQELGIPNPITNEFVLLFSGYLAFTDTLSLPWVIVTVVLADFIGTSVLYCIFYFLSARILQKKTQWLPFSFSKIEQWQEKLSHNKWWGLFIGRLIPFVRGYVSVGAGVVRVSPQTFLPVVFASACVWAGGYVIIGFLFGNGWEKVLAWSHGVQWIVIGILMISIVTIFSNYGLKIWKKRKQNS